MDEWLRGLLRELLSAVDQEDGCPFPSAHGRREGLPRGLVEKSPDIATSLVGRDRYLPQKRHA